MAVLDSLFILFNNGILHVYFMSSSTFCDVPFHDGADVNAPVAGFVTLPNYTDP